MAGDGSLELGPWPEARAAPGRDFDRFAGSRIPAPATGTFADTEGSESSDAHLLALGERFLNGLEDGVDDRGDLALPSIRAFRDRLDEIAFPHGSAPLDRIPNP